jgi:predicted nucleic acid-binding protein
MHCSPLYFQQITVLRSHTPPSIRQSTRSNSPVSVRETHSEPTFCVAWERHCAWSLRLSHICESPEISRSGEGGAQQSIRFATEWLPREAEHCQWELLNVRTISLCCDFLAVRNAFGSSIYISFLLELRLSYFVIMIVLDASTLILIAKADLLDPFLTSINVPVAIPREVAKECCSSKKALDAIIIQKALDESRIEVFTLRNRRLVAKLQTDFSLGQGEAEAIALALDEKAQIIGIDDKNGIDACKVLGIAFTTAVGILIRSWEKGLLEKPDAIAKLALLAKYGRYKHSIIEDARLKLEVKP